MIEARYWFLFALAGAWMVFAIVQDFRKREISNWLNFSLVGFALAYRAFYSASSSDWGFFVYGLIGFGVFYALANLFYYSRVFAGGDAKLFMGIGAVLPFETSWDFATIGGSFVIMLLFAGAVYSLLWSIYIAAKNSGRFEEEFAKIYRNKYYRIAFAVTLLFFFVFGLVFFSGDFLLVGLLVLFPMVSMFLFAYLRAIDKCMVKLVSPGKLTEGDWLVNDIHIGKSVIRRSVHGLSIEEIVKLRRAGKSALIKEGIPFAPVFLIAFIIMVFFSEALLSLAAALIF